MEEGEQVRRALKLIRPPPNLVEECKEEILLTLRLWGFDGATWKALYEVKPKQQKIAAQRFRAALKRVITTSEAFHEGSWMYDYVDLGRPQLVSLAKGFIKKCDHIIDTPAGPPRPNAKKKRWAAQTLFTWSLATTKTIANGLI
jgi:hypothetical protein